MHGNRIFSATIEGAVKLYLQAAEQADNKQWNAADLSMREAENLVALGRSLVSTKTISVSDNHYEFMMGVASGFANASAVLDDRIRRGSAQVIEESDPYEI
jgi:hypothetical protein